MLDWELLHDDEVAIQLNLFDKIQQLLVYAQDLVMFSNCATPMAAQIFVIL